MQHHDPMLTDQPESQLIDTFYCFLWLNDKGYVMVKVMKIFIFVGVLFVVAFFANYFGLVSIPWLDVNSVPTYGSDAVRSDEAVKKLFDE